MAETMSRWPMMRRAFISSLVGLSLAACGGSSGGGSGDIVLVTPVPISPPSTVAEKTISGESFVLSGTVAKQFAFPMTEVVRVYAYGDNGEVIEYDETDYFINGNTIERLPGSSIPDFDDYPVVFNDDGFFSFTRQPRNPPATIRYTLYVDYKTEACTSTIESKLLLADRNNDGEYLVHVYGDSIAAAADTSSRRWNFEDTAGFVGLLRTFLAGDFFSQSNVINKSLENIDSVFLNAPLSASDPTTQLENTIRDGADLVIIAYGMNDQINPDPANLQIFTQRIGDAVDRLRANEVDVILVGFFRKNPQWELAVPGNIVPYNDALASIATSRSVPFIDILAAFDAFATVKDVADDLTGDWIHHPTEFGQKIYFSELLPYFIETDMMENEVDNYVCQP